MIPAQFDYVAPASLDDAVALLRAHDGEAKVLSGGQSLIPMLKLRLTAPTLLVDINRIPGLAYIEERSDGLHIGALAREADLDASATVRARYPILHDTARVIADPIVRESSGAAREAAQWDEAINHLSRATKVDPTFADAFLGLGMSCISARQIAEAIPPLEAYVKMQPANPAGHYHLAVAYSRAGRTEDAKREAALQKAAAEKIEREKQKTADAAQKPEPPQ